KRIVFLGHQRAAGDVANYVLAACAAGSGGGALLKGYAERCFPYVSLAGLDNLLSVPGFIAGVTNPVFEEQTSWWDVLFNINTGRITVSSKIEVRDMGVVAENKDFSKDRTRDWMKNGSWEGDDDFVGEVVFAIQAHMGELYVRQKFYDCVRRFIEVTAAYELESIGTTGIGITPINTGNADLGVGAYFPDEATKRKEMLMLRNRMEGWRSTRSYLFYQKDFQNYLRRRPIKELDIRHAASRLRASSSLEESTVVQLFMTLQDNLVKQSDAGLIELLSLLPQNMGGLMPLATGMFHSRWEVRRASTRILWRLDWHKVGTRFIQNMNPFFRLCYSRSSHDLLQASERESYLEDPSFTDTLRKITTSKSTGSVKDSEKIKTEKRIENRRNTVRMSIMFEAKNASRLNFRTNSLLPPPPVPPLPRSGPSPTPSSVQRQTQEPSSISTVEYSRGPPTASKPVAPPRQAGASSLSNISTVDTLSREQKSEVASLSRSATLKKLDNFMAELEAVGNSDGWPANNQPSAISAQAPKRVDSQKKVPISGIEDSSQRNWGSGNTVHPPPVEYNKDVKERLKMQHQSYYDGSSTEADPVSSYYLDSGNDDGQKKSSHSSSGSPASVSPKNPPTKINLPSPDYPHYIGGTRQSSLKSPKDQPQSPGAASPPVQAPGYFSPGTQRAMGMASTRPQHQQPQLGSQPSPTSPSDVVRKLLASQEANAAEMRRRLTKVATTEMPDLSPITGEPWKRGGGDPKSPTESVNRYQYPTPSADLSISTGGFPTMSDSGRSISGGGSLSRPPPMSPRVSPATASNAPPMSPRMAPKRLNSVPGQADGGLGQSPPMSPRVAPRRLNSTAGSPGEGGQRSIARGVATTAPMRTVIPTPNPGRYNYTTEDNSNDKR
ncbi:hypothetical protein HDU67_010290, partial [Dinochytrium kinnereticum]